MKMLKDLSFCHGGGSGGQTQNEQYVVRQKFSFPLFLMIASMLLAVPLCVSRSNAASQRP